MKLNINSCIKYLKLLLILCSIGLFLFPIKTVGEMTVHDYNDQNTSFFELNNEDLLSQTFVSEVYQLHYLSINLNLQNEQLEDGKIIVSFYTNDNTLLSSKEKTTEELLVNGIIELQMPSQVDSFGKVYRIEIKYIGEETLIFTEGKSNKDIKLSLNNEIVEKRSLEMIYIGKKNNYFFAWYPLTFFAIISVVSTTIKRGNKDE